MFFEWPAGQEPDATSTYVVQDIDQLFGMSENILRTHYSIEFRKQLFEEYDQEMEEHSGRLFFELYDQPKT